MKKGWGTVAYHRLLSINQVSTASLPTPLDVLLCLVSDPPFFQLLSTTPTKLVMCCITRVESVHSTCLSWRRNHPDRTTMASWSMGPAADKRPASSLGWHFSSWQLQNSVLTFLKKTPKGRKIQRSRKIKTVFPSPPCHAAGVWQLGGSWQKNTSWGKVNRSKARQKKREVGFLVESIKKSWQTGERAASSSTHATILELTVIFGDPSTSIWVWQES